MTITSLALHKAIETVWEASGLNTAFKNYWEESKRDQFIVLDEGMAMANTPMPYCVYTQEQPTTIVRMTKAEEAEGRQELHQCLWRFDIYAATRGQESAKDIAGLLASFVLEKFGGHPTVKPQALELDIGGVVLMQYQNDWPTRRDDDVYQWSITYLITTDVPMAE